MYVDASSANAHPFYGYANNGGSNAFHYYDYERDSWNLSFGSSDRLTVSSDGMVGIGVSSPLYKLQVNGSAYISGSTEINNNLNVNGSFDVDNNVNVDGNGNIDGTLTINNNKVVAYNASNSTNLRIYRFTTGNFHITAGPHGSDSAVISFGGGFTSTPFVIVGDIESTGGTTGELDRVVLLLRGCALDTSTGITTCNTKVMNTTAGNVDYNITWNCVVIGY